MPSPSSRTVYQPRQRPAPTAARRPDPAAAASPTSPRPEPTTTTTTAARRRPESTAAPAPAASPTPVDLDALRARAQAARSEADALERAVSTMRRAIQAEVGKEPLHPTPGTDAIFGTYSTEETAARLARPVRRRRARPSSAPGTSRPSSAPTTPARKFGAELALTTKWGGSTYHQLERLSSADVQTPFETLPGVQPRDATAAPPRQGRKKRGRRRRKKAPAPAPSGNRPLFSSRSEINAALLHEMRNVQPPPAALARPRSRLGGRPLSPLHRGTRGNW